MRVIGVRFEILLKSHSNPYIAGADSYQNKCTLHLKLLPRLQPRNVMRLTTARVRDGIETAHLFLNQLRLGRLGVGDVDGARPAGVELENSGSDSNFGQNWFQAQVHKTLAAMF